MLTSTFLFSIDMIQDTFYYPIPQIKKDGATQQLTRKARAQIIVFNFLDQISSCDTQGHFETIYAL